MNRAVFLDRDGTVIEERDYLSDPDQARLIPGAAESLKRLNESGFQLFFVTNQSGIGRGYFSLEQAWAVNARVTQMLEKGGAMIKRTYMAPEAPDQPSGGRKPSPQFLWDARDEFEIDLSKSYMVGDKRIDLECGWNAGVRRALLVRTGYGAKAEEEMRFSLETITVVDDIAGAADWILSDAQRPAATPGASQ